jgi:phosphoribosyl-ATP pyrophosphohydrolase
MSDLIYHAMVLLAARDLAWSDVEAELARRFG